MQSSYNLDSKTILSAVDSHGKKQQIKINPSHAVSFRDKTSYRTFPLANVSSTSFTNATLIKHKIESFSAKKIKSAYLQITVAESGASNSITLAPVWQWFQWIEFVSEGGSGDTIQRLYDDTLMWNIVSNLNNNQLDQVLPLCNCNPVNLFTQDTIPASGSRTYYLPLVGSFFENFNPHLKSGIKDIEMRLQCRAGIVASGSGTASLSSIDMIFEELDGDDDTEALYAADHKVLSHASNYLDFVYVSDNATYTASTNRKINLQNVVGKCAYIFFVVRSGSSVSNTSNARQNFYSLGWNGTIDVLDPSSQSVWGNGVALKSRFLRNVVMPQILPNDYANRTALYCVPFCHNVKAANRGAINGFYEFNGQQNYLSLTPDAAGTSEIITYNCTNPANDSSFYRFVVGSNSTSHLAFNTTAAAMKTALEALPWCRDRRLTFTASGTAETDFTLTITTPDGNDITNRYELVPQFACDSLNDGGVAENCAVSTSTYGTSGFTTGTYTVDVYAAVYKRIYQSSADKGSKIIVQTL